MGWLRFNNVTTKEDDTTPGVSVIEGVVVQTPPIYEFPSRRISTVEIPGRNGDIIIDKRSFNNAVREYNIGSVSADSSFIEKARAIVDWLSSVSGYAKLEDSYEPDYFRLAMYRSGGQLPNFYDKATAINVKFECKPQRFLNTGETQQSIVVDGTFKEILNSTGYIALPEILVENGFLTIEVKHGETEALATDSTVITLLVGAPSENITIDSELQDAYTQSAFINGFISVSNGFPKLYPGKNWIKIAGNVNSTTIVKVKTRLWVL